MSGLTMSNTPPVLKDDKRRIEKISYNFGNPGLVEVEAPVLTCEKTNQKFFHPEDVDNILEDIDKEYERVHKLLEK